MNKKALLEKIAAAKVEMGAAEVDLEKVLREIRVAPRAEKTTMSDVVQKAFVELRSAKARLLELETLVAEEAD